MFANRNDAGRQLAGRLAWTRDLAPVVVAMPRGGVPVAAEVAKRLRAPFDIVVVRKVGCPWQPELGVGAIAEGGTQVLNSALIAEVCPHGETLEATIAREQVELARRVDRYRGDRRPLPLTGRVVILVDDGLATGYTALAAIKAIRARGARRIILAVPVAPASTLASLRGVADDVVVLVTPSWFTAIGDFYADFSQTPDAVVRSLLDEAAASHTPGRPSLDYFPDARPHQPLGGRGR